MNAIDAIIELSHLGFTFTLDGDAIRYTHTGDRPDPERIRPLLAHLRAHKAEAVRYLDDAQWPDVPADPCPTCGSIRWGRAPDLMWVCAVCNPVRRGWWGGDAR